ncbi:hypothetical protein ONE63_002347 [Megalurothrips usitatus]|uniref:Uncharacterized protein n=1 Tax=Megalurothrips usitatus TaxID=439358 RepID=A0AAV7X7X4_9NEOP|nr:hypothetical protein ONE63_002347 [Megalurothrips usitatus]
MVNPCLVLVIDRLFVRRPPAHTQGWAAPRCIGEVRAVAWHRGGGQLLSSAHACSRRAAHPTASRLPVPALPAPAALAPTAADSQTQSPAQTAREWQLPVVDQRTLGVCLHMYLERDFPQIERVVYPHRRPTSAAAALDARSRVLVDGPGLEANCQQLYRLVRCFSRSLARMQYYEDFSEFRRLVVALDAVLLQLCGTVDLMRHRFLPLLQTLNCIEQVRERSSCPYKDRLPPNIWHQLIRLEADSSLCW